jgi:hypothetical protein
MISFTHIIRHVYEDEGQAYVTIRPWADAPRTIELCTTTKHNEEHFGPLSLVMTPSMADELGLALINAAEEARVAKQ